MRGVGTSRFQQVVGFAVAWLLLGAPAQARGQSPSINAESLSRGWSLDVAASGTFLPGLGSAANAACVTASVTLVRTHDTDEFGGHRCLGVTTMFVRSWNLSSSAFRKRPEQWWLVGPRWDGAEPGEPYVFLHVLFGVREDRPAAGVGLGFGIPSAAVGRHALAWRLFEVNWLMAVGEVPSGYRLTIGSGVEFDLRLTSNEGGP